jgi:hypothetical protein
MADYNYLSLVNEVNRRLNEVELSSANFGTATGFYSTVKDAVNASIRHVNHEEFGWPFNHVEQEDILSAGIGRYSYPQDAKHVDMGTFRIKKNTTLNVETTLLKSVDYKDYLANHIEYEYNTDSTVRGKPTSVVLAPNLEFIVFPTPDKAYELVYEYYRNPVDLDLYDDVPSVPKEFKHIIVDGAMFYSFQFRGDTQASQIAQGKFMEGIKYMRTLYINKYSYIRSTYKPSSAFSNYSVKAL